MILHQKMTRRFAREDLWMEGTMILHLKMTRRFEREDLWMEGTMILHQKMTRRFAREDLWMEGTMILHQKMTRRFEMSLMTKREMRTMTSMKCLTYFRRVARKVKEMSMTNP